MDEYFLQYLWNFQKLDSQALVLTDGSKLSVFTTGYQNHDSGPDFLEAKIKIDDLTWSGSVEIHYKSSDWIRHHHHTDKAYENVVLHVVWKHDTEITINDKPIPTLALSDYVGAEIENAYRHYINQPHTIRCADQVIKIPQIQVTAMLDKALAARMKQKAEQVLAILADAEGDWEETAYRVIAKTFGFKTNQESFIKLSSTLPYSVLRKYCGNEQQVYALVFGMAGYLDDPVDSYQQQLHEEFKYLSKKHQLQPHLMKHHWKQARMRPANFPTVRLAQFAAMLTHTPKLFVYLLEISDIKSAQSLLGKPVSDYWTSHFNFGKPSTRKMKLGTSSLNILIINAITPILTAYSKYIDEVSYVEQAQKILEALKPESNHIVDQWATCSIKPKNAADSQGLIYQYNELCKRKKCLLCNIGMAILKPKLTP